MPDQLLGLGIELALLDGVFNRAFRDSISLSKASIFLLDIFSLSPARGMQGGLTSHMGPLGARQTRTSSAECDSYERRRCRSDPRQVSRRGHKLEAYREHGRSPSHFTLRHISMISGTRHVSSLFAHLRNSTRPTCFLATADNIVSNQVGPSSMVEKHTGIRFLRAGPESGDGSL